MRRIATVALALGLAFGAASCSNSVSVDRTSNNGKMCEQVTKNKFLGITYSTDRSLRNC